MMAKSNISAFSLISILCVLTLFLVLSFGAVSVIIAGSAVYENIAQSMDGNYEKRVTMAFLANKIREHDSGSIGVEQFNGVNAIAVRETFLGWDGWEFVTFIYFDAENGVIREIYLDAEFVDEFELTDGAEIISSGGFDFVVSETYIKIILTGSDGITRESRISLRAGRGSP